MVLDIEKIRSETPGVKNKIHFNNAGASLISVPVYQAVLQHLDLERDIGGYEAQAAAVQAVEQTYSALATLLNCQSTEIALMENASTAWGTAFHGMAFQKGDRILTAEAEYASNVISYLQIAKKTGVTIDVIPSDSWGQTDIAALENMIDDTVKLISISHIPTNGGLINPAAAIGQIARKAGIPYLLDACQSAGQIPLDVAEIGCDMLSASGRKYLRGPRGTGFLYVRQGFMEKLSPPLLDLHSAEWTARDSFQLRGDARRFETFERNIAAVIGLGVAAAYFSSLGPKDASIRLCSLAADVRRSLTSISGIKVHDLGNKKGGIVTFTHDRYSPDEIKQILSEQDVNISVSPAAATRFDMERRSLDHVARASFHYYNTTAEATAFLNILDNL